MNEPLQHVFYGQGMGPNLYLAGSGFQDGGEPVQFRARTNPYRPGGPGGEALFRRLRLAVTQTMAVRLRVTPILDGVPVAESTYEVDFAASAERVQSSRELKLFRGVFDSVDASVMTGTVALRGERLEVLVESLVDSGGGTYEPGIGEGDLMVDDLSVEVEVVRRSQGEEAAP